MSSTVAHWSRLILENQDFDLLQPKEATDEIDLPPWLRLYWRRQHPEWEYISDDPTGGYPLALENYLTWLLTHQDLQPEPDVQS